MSIRCMRPLAEVEEASPDRGGGSARDRAWTTGETLGRAAARTELARSGVMRFAQQLLAGRILEVGAGVDVALHVTRRRRLKAEVRVVIRGLAGLPRASVEATMRSGAVAAMARVL